MRQWLVVIHVVPVGPGVPSSELGWLLSPSENFLRGAECVAQRKEAAHKQGEAEIGTLRAKEAREATELAQSRRRLERATQGRFLSDQTQAGEE